MHHEPKTKSAVDSDGPRPSDKGKSWGGSGNTIIDGAIGNITGLKG